MTRNPNAAIPATAATPVNPSPDVDQHLRSALLDPKLVRFGISEEDVRALDDAERGFDIIGQPRALRALHLAVQMRGKGYNLFVTGMPGTGKRSAIRQVTEQYRGDLSRLRDYAYVYNFHRPDRPRLLTFAPGAGTQFRDSMHALVKTVRQNLEALSQNERFTSKRDQIIIQAEGHENKALRDFEGRIGREGFQIVQVEDSDEQQRTDIAPVYDGETTSFDAIQKRVNGGEIDESWWRSAREKYYQYMDEMNQIFLRLRSERGRIEQKLKELRVAAIEPGIDQAFAEIKAGFADPAIHRYLDEARSDILENVDWFMPPHSDAARDEPESLPIERYDVNVIVNHRDSTEAPLVFESHPDYQKLFGLQEYAMEPGGETRTSFMMLRAGALLNASGGFLVLRAEDIIPHDDLWNALKRAIGDARAEIRPTPGPLPVPVGALKPEPAPIDVKVILSGPDSLYDILYNQDDEFGKLFKVPAEFDSMMERSPETMREYVGFARLIAREEQLLPLHPSALAAIMEYGVRLSEFRDKLSTRFSQIADLIREADHWARGEGMSEINRDMVDRTLNERRYLYNLPEEKIDEQILSGELLIDVRGSAVGRINGLAIVDRGFYAFARPMLITARTAPGSDGIINIERESGLSGELHDKGIYILEGFLQSKYAHDFPLSITASVCFEQSYVEVDGDSASSAEVYVLLSAIADVPLRQDIAVTGSVNQMGEIQPVGGISEKVEGFYQVCLQMGITTTQGVIIPRQNLPNLILSYEVQQAIQEGRFHIWTVQTIDEGMQILTGVPSGNRGPRGGFESGSVNALVEKRLRSMAHQVKSFGGN
ncbi:MAG: ATP-binding protein [Spirochaetaceae bacterium]|nr:MAG: ATP-binding protein [Spirochaetaceae bacterium]